MEELSVYIQNAISHWLSFTKKEAPPVFPSVGSRDFN